MYGLTITRDPKNNCVSILYSHYPVRPCAEAEPKRLCNMFHEKRSHQIFYEAEWDIGLILWVFFSVHFKPICLLFRGPSVQDIGTISFTVMANWLHFTVTIDSHKLRHTYMDMHPTPVQSLMKEEVQFWVCWWCREEPTDSTRTCSHAHHMCVCVY